MIKKERKQHFFGMIGLWIIYIYFITINTIYLFKTKEMYLELYNTTIEYSLYASIVLLILSAYLMIISTVTFLKGKMHDMYYFLAVILIFPSFYLIENFYENNIQKLQNPSIEPYFLSIAFLILSFLLCDKTAKKEEE